MFDSQGGAGTAARAVRDPAWLDAQLVSADALQRLVLPVVPALRPLFPDGGLPRGVAVGVDADGAAGGATSLGLVLSAAASAAGSWVAVVGMGELGLAALVGWAGLDPSRVLLVDQVTVEAWPKVVGALLAAVDVVVAPAVRMPARVGRQLATAARERNGVVVTIGRSDAMAGFDPAVRLRVVASAWEGLGSGHGYLRARRVQVERQGRGSAARPERHWLWLPGPDGAVAPAPPPVGLLGSDGVGSGGVEGATGDAGSEGGRVLAWPGGRT
jgi:hypothetical protein